ncbi:hypothetical protein FIBSPDRAFT_727758 [Athelia psychrophila]|uniref:FAS1 domain-containing protein n=1 Tax=Athelia psychrophila TaxID=1759441 RepID=A0A166SBN4_9AGAM|nr:hypothetical protein FIBSPDRAFT_727758 [Fibularhizoctonia sp. CBS 109695]
MQTYNAQPSLADLLTIESSASIFFSYARELELSSMFVGEGPDGDVKMTLLVPTNKAVMALSRKPHQGPQPDSSEIEISEQEFEQISKKNVERWISAHIIPTSPINLEGKRATLLDGKSVTFTPSTTRRTRWEGVLVDDDAKIIGMKVASNGVLYLLDGTIKFD